MKRAISVKLCVVVLVAMLAILLMNYRLQIRAAQTSMVVSSDLRIEQIKELLVKNQADIQRMKDNLREDYIIRTKAAAYIVEHRPEIAYDVEELRRVAELLQIDELHLFDSQGVIYSGTEPRYYGYHFNSGEQMAYFLPLLEDKDLEMCQDVTPNTAEQKLMQYTALWREDGQGIVQTGMEPVRLMEALRKTELPEIFGTITADPGITIFAVDGDSGEILGSTNRDLTGRLAREIGLDWRSGVPTSGGFSAKLDGVDSYCVFRRLDSGMWLGVTRSNALLYRHVPRSMIFATLSVAGISAAIILLILHHIDRHIIKGINTVIDKLRRITDGDLDTRVEVGSSPEFKALSHHINRMVGSLLENTDKLSLIFQNVNVPIAAYEYNQDMARVRGTSRLGDILMMPGDELLRLLTNREFFEKKMADIKKHPLEGRPDRDIYLLEGDERRYVKIKTYKEGNSTFGVVIDVTEEMRERQSIAQERDVDQLTCLSSRRAFFRHMDILYEDPAALGHTAIFMGDVDSLKQINDTYGHEYGDRLLQAAGALLRGCEAPHKEVARLSGDEFVLFVYACADEEEAKSYLDRVETRMGQAELSLPDGGVFPVRMSGGYVLDRDGRGGYRELLRLADQTMYEAKRNGKGRFIRYTPQ